MRAGGTDESAGTPKRVHRATRECRKPGADLGLSRRRFGFVSGASFRRTGRDLRALASSGTGDRVDAAGTTGDTRRSTRAHGGDSRSRASANTCCSCGKARGTDARTLRRVAFRHGGALGGQSALDFRGAARRRSVSAAGAIRGEREPRVEPAAHGPRRWRERVAATRRGRLGCGAAPALALWFGVPWSSESGTDPRRRNRRGRVRRGGDLANGWHARSCTDLRARPWLASASGWSGDALRLRSCGYRGRFDRGASPEGHGFRLRWNSRRVLVLHYGLPAWPGRVRI